MESTQSFKELVAAVAAKDLKPDPQYQRGAKWTLPQKRSLIDSLLRGYVQSWRKDYCHAFGEFILEVQKARDAFKKERQRSVLYDDFAVPLAGSGSDKADAIRRRHMVFADWMYRRVNFKPKDPKRLFDPLEREIVWERDSRTCKNPKCDKLVLRP